MEGLNDIIRKNHRISNKVSKYLEDEIIKIIKKDPKLGPRSISYILEENGYSLGETGIYNVMKRLNLNVKKKRMDFSGNKNSNKSSCKYIKKNLADAEKKIHHNNINLEKNSVGHLLIQWTIYLGNIKNLGKIYQMTVLDSFSNCAIAKIYNSKASINVEDIMESAVMPTTKALEVKIDNIITKNSREYTTNWKNGKHRYDKYLKSRGINHLILYKDNHKIVRLIEDFQKEIYKYFYKDIIIHSKDIEFKDIEIKLQEFLRFHNFKKPKDFNKGKTPIEIIIEDRGNIPLPLWFFVDVL